MFRILKLKITKISKEVWISLGLLSIPVLFTTYLFLPLHEQFESPGDIVSVQELGIDGSVNFTYVYGGVTEKRLDKFLLSLTKKDIKFTPLKSYEYELYHDYYESETDVYQEQTVNNAVALAESDEAVDAATLQGRVDEILDHTSKYRGDSMGLMVAIGMVEEANHLDFSQNQMIKIAGTGTINEDQTVGEIGAIRSKLLTAELNQVDYFLLPMNLDKDDGYLSNLEEAVQIWNEEKLRVQLVPVSTLDEAITFLKKLKY